MESYLRPYLIIPKLIQQPTWGGEYIINLKGLGDKEYLRNYKIGQSYELFSGTKLFLANKASDERYLPEIGFADTHETLTDNFPLKEHSDYQTLTNLISLNPKSILGDHVIATYGIMPLLIKINHAKGNSFQLHIPPSIRSQRWEPKPESWFYLETGKLTCGLRSDVNIENYKKVCLEIDAFMHDVSKKIIQNQQSVEEGRYAAKEFIQRLNPWQFVNVVDANKYDIFDMSHGGIHHSWEEDDENYPIGNVIYEVQLDKMDPVSTIRSFDQGKIKDDGTIREIAIEDYFKFIDRQADHNAVESIKEKPIGNTYLSTDYFAMDLMELKKETHDKITHSFVHLYVRDGSAEISAGDTMVAVNHGYSCFIPYGVEKYTLNPKSEQTVILKTYIP